MSKLLPQPAKALIVNRGEKLSDVAAAIRCNRQSFYNVLSARVPPWPSLSERLAEYLNVDESDLWFDDKPIADAARRLAQTTRKAQGLPSTVTDAQVLEKVAALVTTSAE